MFRKSKLILRLLDRIEVLEATVNELHSQNLKLIEMIGHLQHEIAELRAMRAERTKKK